VKSVCEVTQDFVAFLTTFEPQANCDGLFQGKGEEEYATFCTALSQTVAEFAALGIDWNDASYTFPDICDPARGASTVCQLCLEVRDAFATSAGRPDWTALTRTIVDDVFTTHEDCAAAIKSNRRGGDGFGSIVCNYALSVNGDFTCAAWQNLVDGCAAQGLDEEACFASRLQSTLIQSAAFTLHTSDYCAALRNRRLDILI
jgi:hypothetical protein